MKLLFDQNLPFKLPPILDSVFPGAKHAKNFGLTGNDNEAIWQLAWEQVTRRKSWSMGKSKKIFIAHFSHEERGRGGVGCSRNGR